MASVMGEVLTARELEPRHAYAHGRHTPAFRSSLYVQGRDTPPWTVLVQACTRDKKKMSLENTTM